MSRVSEALSQLGFTFVTLDLAGYRPGSVAAPLHRGVKEGVGARVIGSG
jgi:PP-loop superfamily ATP-utilizing enzyme